MDATREEWRPVIGYEGYYEVSNLGRVKSLRKAVPGQGGGRRTHPGGVMHPWIHSFGYSTVRLSVHGKRATHYVHQLVLMAFRGQPGDGMVCCHNDGDPTNNRLDNLRWDTQAENLRDRVRHGTEFWSNRTHCKYGHEYTPENVVRWGGRPARYCRTCQKQRVARRRAARNEAAKCGG